MEDEETAMNKVKRRTACSVRSPGFRAIAAGPPTVVANGGEHSTLSSKQRTCDRDITWRSQRRDLAI